MTTDSGTAQAFSRESIIIVTEVIAYTVQRLFIHIIVAVVRQVFQLVIQWLHRHNLISNRILITLSIIDEPGTLCDTGAQTSTTNTAEQGDMASRKADARWRDIRL